MGGLHATPCQVTDSSIHREFHEFVVKWSPVANSSHHDGVDRDHDVPRKPDVLSQFLKCVTKTHKGREIRIRCVNREGGRGTSAHDRSAFKHVPWTKVPSEKELLVHYGTKCGPDGSGVPCFKIVVPRSQVDVVVVVIGLCFLPSMEPKRGKIEVLDLDANRKLVVLTTMGITTWW